MFRNATLVMIFIVIAGTSLGLDAAAAGRPCLLPGGKGPGPGGLSREGTVIEIEPARRSTIDSVFPESASPGETVTIHGRNFGGSPGYVVLTGLRADAAFWSDSLITFVVPAEGASGSICIRNSGNQKSNSAAFTVDRALQNGQFEPAGIELLGVGLPGAAFLVETDGEYLYAMSGFERLATYRIMEGEPYEPCSCLYLPQRVGDLRIHDGYLYVAGDQGIWIYRCSDLQAGNDQVAAAIAGGSFMTCDIKEKEGVPVDGTLVALCEYRPWGDSGELQVPLYLFESGELEKIGAFSRTMATATERQFALAIDPLNPKVYVSGWETILGRDKYILEIDITDPADPLLNHKEKTGILLAFDMDAISDHLWIGVSNTGYLFFRSFLLQAGTDHLLPDENVRGDYGIGRTTRLKIIDDSVTVGSAWHGARPDVLLMSTYDNGSLFQAESSTVDWAFDVTGFAKQTANHDGKIIVADEWGGFLTSRYQGAPNYSIEHEPEHQVMAAAMTEGIHIFGDRIYIAGRGAGPWSADRYDLADESSWRSVPWDWSEAEPQPHPVGSLCTRTDPELGTLIVGQGFEKAMAWGDRSYGILYQETADSIIQCDKSMEFNPPGLLGSGVDAVWPEQDLVFMTMGSHGIRAFVIDPDPAAPTITVHKDCVADGFGGDVFTSKVAAWCMHGYRDGSDQKLVVGAKLDIFSNALSFYVFDVEYPEGVPDRDFPDRSIVVTLEQEFVGTRSNSVLQIDMTDSGLVVATTELGLAVFHISWIPALNDMGKTKAWNKVKLPTSVYDPWWSSSWGLSFDDACFKDDGTLYCVKEPDGIWKVDLAIDWVNYTHDNTASAYYSGVQCGMDLDNFLAGWGNPDIVTLHHPYGIVTDGESIYVTGWSGKVYRLGEQQP